MPYKQALHWTLRSPHRGQAAACDPWSIRPVKIDPHSSGKPLYPVGFSTTQTAAFHGLYSALFSGVQGSQLGTNPCPMIYNTMGQSESGFLAPIFMLCVLTMTVQEMEKRLLEQFPGAEILITDLTGNGSNFEVRMSATQFKGQNRIQQQRSIMAVLDPELKSGEVHALTMKTMVKE